MSKGTTIASLIRTAAKDESEFKNVVQNLLDEADQERSAEFFDRLNIPRSVGSQTNLEPLLTLNLTEEMVGTWDEEKAISEGIQKFMARHERKLKWHANHPSLESCENTMLLTRAVIVLTDLRLRRLVIIMNRSDELNAHEWSIARELMNRAFLSFRNILNILAGEWIDAMQTAVARDDLTEKLGNFYEYIDTHIRQLDDFHQKLEERRTQLTVVPDGYPPVKPPNYFGGDLMGRGPWNQYWGTIDSRAHHFREVAA